ncbi:pantothenate synthetase [Shewanella morhuae]|uniref:pantoate--beta-alanine ligase n=1 Tax=Shewanella morhuae TaxID=365591 RepID=UPI000953CB15|nr:pantoate--beta-alanine ligase [Shewanella morhuae]SIQ77770.1 pantothenate synthetase [Shewanella morhuae]
MITSAHIDDIRTQVRAWRAKGETIAFVPTMGNLHQGHITLVREAAQKCDHVVVSIFVNPMQFGQNEDLDAYPRTLAADSAAITAAGAELLFTPTPAVMYPKGLSQQTFVEVPMISDVLCGASRPGHFRGVATIVCKLFNIVQPDLAFFGNKDYQQLLVIQAMVEDLSLPIEIIGVDTIREDSGLAMSSRNCYLTDTEKAAAPALKIAIDAMAKGIKQGESIDAVTEQAQASLVAAGFTPDYLEIRHAHTLEAAQRQDQALVILAAAYIGKARLIDNLRFER